MSPNPNPEISPDHPEPAQGRSAPWRWIARAWQWRAEVRPVPTALALTAWMAFGAWLTPDRGRALQGVLAVALALAVAGLVVLLVSIWWQRRRTRKEEPRA